jgi:hypothetical protein
MTLRSIARAAALGASLALGACVTPIHLEPEIQPAAPPSPGVGYVAGLFSRSSGSGFAFVLCDDAAHERRIAFGDGKGHSTHSPQPSMIALPPGAYRVCFWQTYAPRHRESYRLVPLNPRSALARRFQVRSGQVTVLGSFAASTESFGWTGRVWAIEPQPLSPEEATAVIHREYPGHGGAAVSCLLCDDQRSAADTMVESGDLR